MFTTIKKWFEKKQGLKKEVYHSALTSRRAGSPAIRAEVSPFRGPKTFSEEVISRVAKEIELEGLGAPRSTGLENPNDKGLNRS